ncbi:hypothetical protein L21SP2_0537 [Salinispira pacifica]|uniref:Uncharacterized protein n=1 Tax=Salinispira pacifica TaxID=1307761 RepID=V5WEH9_9SPIO|nr:hypothetical protein L21SP2_0537 [Salinispira pacifica]
MMKLCCRKFLLAINAFFPYIVHISRGQSPHTIYTGMTTGT